MKKVLSLIMSLILISCALCSCKSQEEIAKEKTKEITEAIENADYIQSKKILDENPNLPNYAEIFEQIKYETLFLQCCKSLQSSLIDPRSLLVTDVGFYNTLSQSNKSETGTYPYILITYNAKNKFGGYVGKKIVGFGPWDLEDYFTAYSDSARYSDQLYEINDLELERFNKWFEAGTTPKINAEQYMSH